MAIAGGPNAGIPQIAEDCRVPLGQERPYVWKWFLMHDILRETECAQVLNTGMSGVPIMDSGSGQ